MQYSLKIIEDKNQRNNFVIDNFKFYSFLNSRERWEFQILEWKKIFRYWIFDSKDKFIGEIMLIKFKAKRWTYFLAPHAPLILDSSKYFEILWAILPELRKIAKKEKVSFMRIAPQIENTVKNLSKYRKLKFKFAPLHAHAEETHLLDLSLSEDVLLKNMRKTTRYIVKRSAKEWVKISHENSKESINHFINMHIQHSRRTNGKLNYTPFSKSYIEHLFQVFDKTQITLLNAEYENYIEASLVSIRFGKTCVYYLWASDIKHPKFSPAYLIQREAIKKAKADSCVLYNFRWVSPDQNKNHPLHGVSLFKRWFGGYDFNLLHAQDYIFSPKYRITFAIEFIRKKKRAYYFIKPKN